MIFQAFYSSTNAEQPMSRSDVETYIWLGQAFLAALPWSIDTGFAIVDQIRRHRLRIDTACRSPFVLAQSCTLLADGADADARDPVC